MDNRSVGIFDSGLGGLTSLLAFRSLMPDENIIYIGDTERCPCGGKSKSELETMTQLNIDFLKAHDVKAIIVACGTLSANGKKAIDACDVHTENVLDSSLAVASKTDGKIAVIATEASIRSNAFSLNGRDIIGIACPEFVPLIECGHLSKDDNELADSVDRSLNKIKGIDNLILGCTHFGLIREAIAECVGNMTNIIEASQCAAVSMANYLKKNEATGGTGKLQIYCTGDVDAFNKSAERIFNAKGCNYQYAQRARI